MPQNMMTQDDILGAIEKIDRQLVHLVAERKELISQIPGGLDEDQELELMGILIDEAVERELDESVMEKLGKLLSQICRKRGE